MNLIIVLAESKLHILYVYTMHKVDMEFVVNINTYNACSNQLKHHKTEDFN